jgi:sugar phosphate isomerase/epimerase
LKTGYHAVYENDYISAIDNAKKNGFEFVQFDLGVPKFFLDEFSDEDLIKIREHAKNQNIEITFHSPGDNVSLFCDYPLIRKGILDQFKLILKKVNIIGARHITIHGGEYPRFKKSGFKSDEFTDKAHYEKVLYEIIKELINCSENVLICLENYKFNELIMDTAKKLIKEGYALYLTLDTAKMYNSNFKIDNEVFGFMETYKDFIREIHIHDFNEEFGSHQIVGTGIVDFSLFKEFLQSDNVYINFEIRPIEAAKISKDKLMLLKLQ